MAIEIFTDEFLNAVQSLVGRHHTIYPRLPPQGIFFEALVEQAFRKAGWSVDDSLPQFPTALGTIYSSEVSNSRSRAKPESPRGPPR